MLFLVVIAPPAAQLAAREAEGTSEKGQNVDYLESGWPWELDIEGC